MARTKGHITHVTVRIRFYGQCFNVTQSAYFHPNNRDIAITSSLDCTIRFWNLESYKEHKNIIKVKNAVCCKELLLSNALFSKVQSNLV